jgi:8-oxo-dGTP pyrophosphatase MutT (NUDIX family)
LSKLPDLVAIRAVEARVAPYAWPFAAERKDAIAAHWAALSRSKPAMYNGQVLLQRAGERRGDVFHADYFPIDYASFVTWLAAGAPETGGVQVRNGFAMGALKSRDGAYLMGVMGDHTANAGKVYFAAGTPDLGDVTADGAVDLAGSVLRELEEETGLTADEVSVGEGWRAIIGRERIAFMRALAIDLDADEAKALMLARIARQAEPELAGIAIARSRADIDPERMPLFMQAFLQDAFAS